MDPRALAALGWVSTDRANAFARFDPRKAAGAERIGWFGDSFTLGDEVADGFDPPALLDREFEESGRPGVEVLNFGSNWYGFHQAYFLWESVGTKFDLDAVVLGPGAFQEERDTTFNHTGDFEAGALHARYVLDGEGLRRVDLLGETPYRRYRRYYAWWTPAPYRKFDRRPPVFLRCVVPSKLLPRNPFYYFEGTIEEEARETYRRLLSRMAQRARRVVLVHHRPEIVEMARALDLPGLVAEVAPRILRFPYVAPRGHGSPAANRLLARQVLDLLSGRTESPREVSESSHRELSRLSPTGAASARGLHIAVGEMPIGDFYRMGSGGFPERVEDLPAGLLAIRGEGQGILDGILVPIEGSLARPASMRVRSAAGEETVRLEPPRTIGAGIPLSDLTLPGVRLVLHTHFGLQAYLEFEPGERRGTAAEVRLGNDVLLQGRSESAERPLPLEAPHPASLFVRARGDVLLGERERGKTFDLVVAVPGREARIPLSVW